MFCMRFIRRIFGNSPDTDTLLTINSAKGTLLVITPN